GVRESGIRVVWQIDLPDISGTHLHPADMRGAIVSLDRSRPYGSWRWGGPQWTGKVAGGSPGRLAGITMAVADPDAVAARWAHVLGVPVRDGGDPALGLGGAAVAFTTAAAAPGEGLIGIAHEPPPARRGERQPIEVGGVSLRPVAAGELT